MNKEILEDIEQDVLDDVIAEGVESDEEKY
jgi:hypothetical protein